jgi:predicted neuraminidase
MAAWYAGSHELARDITVLGAFFRKKTGRWTDPFVLVEPEAHSLGNPILFCMPDGDLWLLYAVMHRPNDWGACSLKYRISTDHGVTFGPAHVFRDELGWMARNKPIVLSGGEILLPLYDDRHRHASVFLISSDSGRTWEIGEPIDSDPGNEQPTVAELRDGALLCLMRTQGAGPLWGTRSHDRGRSWSLPLPVSLPNPDAGIDMIRTARGRLLLAFNNSLHFRTPLSVAASDDEGRTWKVVSDVETGPGEYSYPAIIQAADGTIHLLYTRKRYAIVHAMCTEAALDEERRRWATAAAGSPRPGQ